MARLGDLYQITSGGTPSRKHLDYYQDGTIPWVKTGDLKEKYLRATDEKITEIGLKNSSARIYPKDTVLIAMYGATIGASSILKIEAATNQACAAFVKRDDVIPEYLYAFLESQQSRFIEDAVGGAQPNISAGYLKQIDMPLIPVEEQRRIAALLDKVSDLIAKRRQQLDKLDEMVKAKFVEMFGEPGEDKNNWGINCLGDVCEINPKKSLDKRLVNDFIVSFIPMPAVTENGEIDPSESKTYDEVRTGFTYFVENDVLFAKITPCMENGKGAIAKGLYNGVGFGSTEFHVLRPIKDKTTAPWLYALTSLPKFRLDAADNMTGSAGQRRVPASFLTTYKVAAPPIELQEQFSTLYNQISKSKLTIQRSCDKLEVLKKALMQRYFG